MSKTGENQSNGAYTVDPDQLTDIFPGMDKDIAGKLIARYCLPGVPAQSTQPVEFTVTPYNNQIQLPTVTTRVIAEELTATAFREMWNG